MSDHVRNATTRDVADKYGCSMPAVKLWRDAGMPCEKRGTNYYYDLDEVSAWIRKTGRGYRIGQLGGDTKSLSSKALVPDEDGNPPKRGPGRPPKAPPSEREAAFNLELEHKEAKLRKDLAAAERAELELEKLRGLLVPADEVKEQQLARIAYARARLIGIPATMAPYISEEAQGLLRDRIFDALEELSK